MENHLAAAIPCAYWPQAARGMPSRCGPRHRDSGTRRRSRRGVVSNPTGAQQPPTDRIPCLEASAPMPDSMPHACALPIRNPPRRSLDAQGRTPAGGPQGPRHFFGFFAPCAARANNAKNCRRNTSISTPDFASSLAGTPVLLCNGLVLLKTYLLTVIMLAHRPRVSMSPYLFHPLAIVAVVTSKPLATTHAELNNKAVLTQDGVSRPRFCFTLPR